MKFCATALAACLLFGGSAAVASAPSVQDLVDQFNPANYQDLLMNKLYTRPGMNRLAGTGSHHDLCRDAIYDELRQLGVSVVKDPFTYRDTANIQRDACNIIAIFPGVQNPENEIYVVGAHYDSKDNPGADDNATGVACLLEMARIFSRYHFARTLILCAFDAEETYDYYNAHRLGSLRFVEQHRLANIQSMISVDMIGWQSPVTLNNTVNIEGRTHTAPLRYDLGNAVQLYGEGLKINYRQQGNYSDHVAFADAGFQACLMIEANWSQNPNYHKITDDSERANYLDWNYIGRICRSVIGYYASKLEPVDVAPAAISINAAPAAQIEFAGLPRCAYAVEVTTSLTASEWAILGTNVASETGLFTSVDAGAPSRPESFYRARFVSGYTNMFETIIVDNTAATVVGPWLTGTSAVDKYGSNYRHIGPGSGANHVEFRPVIQTPGNYRVYEFHPQGDNRTTGAPVQITFNGGTTNLWLNQQINGGTWNHLGTFPFAQGTGGFVRIRDNFSGSVVIADAIKLVREDPSIE
jgi:hypothetical protein